MHLERRGKVTDDKTLYSGHMQTAGADGALDEMGTEWDLAIVGGGFSGLCTAYHLLIHEGLKPDFRCIIIEPGERLGAGVAYQTDSPYHLLNVRAKGMSIIDTDTSSFVRWLMKVAPEFSPDDFVPRGLYRVYTNECLSLAAMQRQPDALTLVRDEEIGRAHV